MRKFILFFVLIVLLLARANAVQKKPIPGPRKVHIEGERAHVLISLLVNGSARIDKEIEGSPKHEVALHDFSVEAASTYKADPDQWEYKLLEYSATAKVGSDEDAVDISEATSLWKFFSELGVKPNLGLEGAFLNVSEIDCKINGKLDVAVPTRFQCDLVIPY